MSAIRPLQKSTLDTTCPTCKSDATQSFQMIYQSGTSVGVVSGVGVDSDGGIGVVGGRGVSRTLLAQKVAPPQSPKVLAVLGLVFVFVAAIAAGIGSFYIALLFDFILLAGVIGFVVGVAVGVLAWFAANNGYKKYESEYKKQAYRWANSWMCLRCGHAWIPRPKRAAAD